MNKKLIDSFKEFIWDTGVLKCYHFTFNTCLRKNYVGLHVIKNHDACVTLLMKTYDIKKIINSLVTNNSIYQNNELLFKKVKFVCLVSK